MAAANAMTDEQKHDLIIDALRTMDMTDYKSQPELEVALTTRVRTIQSLLSERSLPMRMLDSIPIRATVTGIELEANTNRYLVHFRARNAEEGAEDEIIRSDRTDGWNGRAVTRMWEKIQVGDYIQLYKLTEDTNNPKKPKVRVAPYVMVLRKAQNAQ